MATGQVTPAQIARMATGYGLDPNAVLAVAKQEGLGGGIGDGGHAYGPFQLNNAGGVISNLYGGHVNDPSVQQWAWSPAGVNYALQRIAGVAKGLHGSQAVNAIVSRFERPANPQKEIAGALAAYGAAPIAGSSSGRTPGSEPAVGGSTPSPAAPRSNGNIAAALRLLGFTAPAAPAAAPQPKPPTVTLNQTSTAAPVEAAFKATGLGQVAGATQGENPRLLTALAQLAAFEHSPVQINSGYRSYQKQAQLYANRASNPNPVAKPGTSLHERGLAADGTVGGVPLGTLPASVLARFGLAKVPGDPVHIQLAV